VGIAGDRRIVNVTTLAPTRPLEGSVSVEAGSHQSVNAHAGLGGSSSIIDWRISGSAFTTQDPDARRRYDLERISASGGERHGHGAYQP
jgi:hypothetical protein